MDAFIKWLGRTGLTAIIWVFILSISWNGKTLFDRAHDILIDNSIVRAIDEKMAEIWDNVTDTARATMDGERPDDKA